MVNVKILTICYKKDLSYPNTSLFLIYYHAFPTWGITVASFTSLIPISENLLLSLGDLGHT